MDIKRQTFLVVGVSKSGFAVANYILSNGGKCLLYEELSSPKIDDAISKLKLVVQLFEKATQKGR